MGIVRTSPVLSPAERPHWDTIKPMPASLASDRRPVIIGHRGARGLAPENTMPAFQIAADLGIDGVEFDVQRTRDGKLIVFHDENVKRITTVDGMVEAMTLDEIKALDAGSTFGPDFAGERIPTLREVLDFLRQTDLLLFIELKDPWRYAGMEAAIIRLLREFDMIERTQIRSFYHAVLHLIHALEPELAVSELWLDRLPTDDEVIYKTIDAYHPLFTAENLAQIHRRGQEATAWTVNELDEARRLMDAGIDGLATDFPDRLLTLFDS
jgi:glycerophosphoryl diester phosphodiesterase